MSIIYCYIQVLFDGLEMHLMRKSSESVRASFSTALAQTNQQEKEPTIQCLPCNSFLLKARKTAFQVFLISARIKMGAVRESNIYAVLSLKGSS